MGRETPAKTGPSPTPHWEEPPDISILATEDIDREALETYSSLVFDIYAENILYLMLEGVILPTKIAGQTGLDPYSVQKIQRNPEFCKLLDDARRDVTASGIDRIKAGVHRKIRDLDELCGSNDPRIRLDAIRDWLNRGGTSPSAKVEVGPMAYKKMVDRYRKKSEGGEEEE